METIALKPRGRCLEIVSPVIVPAATKPFVATEKFVVNLDPKEGVLISRLGDNFSQRFGGKIEAPNRRCTLQRYKLKQPATAATVAAELGSMEKSETTLYELFFLMEKQKYGQGGVLLNTAWLNIFYIRDSRGILWTVLVGWYRGGWDIEADIFGHPFIWYVGCQVFSHLDT